MNLAKASMSTSTFCSAAGEGGGGRRGGILVEPPGLVFSPLLPPRSSGLWGAWVAEGELALESGGCKPDKAFADGDDALQPFSDAFLYTNKT